MEIPNDPKAVVDAALEFEKQGYQILCDAGDKSGDPLSKATFEFLAEQELHHIDTIKAFAGALAESGEFDPNRIGSPLTGEQLREGIRSIFERIRPEFEATAGKDEERMEVYAAALNMERHGHDFYESAAGNTSDAAAQKLYEFLTAEETKHFTVIQETRDFLRQPDAFMAIEEHWMTF